MRLGFAILAASLVLFGGLFALSPRVATAQESCSAWVDDKPIGDYSTFGRAISFDKGDTVSLLLTSDEPLGNVQVKVSPGLGSLPTTIVTSTGGGRSAHWSGDVKLDETLAATGRYHVTMKSGSGCALGLWVNIEGGNPVTTPIGGAASAGMALGLLGQAASIVRSWRARGSLPLTLIGGLIAGLSACVLSQQAGLTPITPQWAAIWSFPPMAIGSVIQAGASALGGKRDESYTTVPLPPTPQPPPPSEAEGAFPNGGARRPETAPPYGRPEIVTGAEPPVMAEPHPRMAEPPASMAEPQATTVDAHPPMSQPEQQMAESPGSMPEPERQMAEPPASMAEPEPQLAEPPPARAEPQPSMPEPRPSMAGPRPNGGYAATTAPELGTSPTRRPNGEAAVPTRRSIPSGAEGVSDPPRTAFALLECADAVVAEREFDLRVGLGAEATPGVAGGSLIRPEGSRGPYVLTVQVVADGFTHREGETWRHDLPVTADAAYPTFVIHLTPDPQPETVKPRAIQAIYSVGGQAMGFAVRSVAVVRSDELLATTPVPPKAPEMTMTVPTDEPAADLTIRIQRADSQSGGKLLWTFDTPHEGIDMPDAALTTDIGEEPDKFARQLIDALGVREGQTGLQAYLLGLGLTIADQMPAAFWDLLSAVATRAVSEGRKPSVFILSQEPYVPWELAALTPPLDPGLPRFLGAQVSVGRWVLGQPRPSLPPPSSVAVSSMAVISGVYEQPGWNRLLEAEQEAATLAQVYGAASVQATTTAVLDCLAGMPKADALHFAMHGIYDPNSVLNGLVLTDGLTLDPLQVKSSSFASPPFVFLNACQVGSGSKVLGDYSGMAEAFLYAGAAGVVAPLWSIKDTTARETAVRFYEQAFAGVPPAEILRRERASFGPANAATCLAYIWFGHPSFSLNRPT